VCLPQVIKPFQNDTGVATTLYFLVGVRQSSLATSATVWPTDYYENGAVGKTGTGRKNSSNGREPATMSTTNRT
jgi:hypothetical protein